MRILFLGPLPEPITGHSLACKVFLDDLLQHHDVEVVNLSKSSFKEGLSSFGRILEVFGMLKQVWSKKKGVDAIYLTISESFAGNLKDLLIYLICYRQISKMTIHLHGGSIKKLLWNRFPILSKINKKFIQKMRNIVVLGGSHVNIFEGMIDKSKVHIVPNFAQDFLFRTEEEIKVKFKCVQPIRILFMSNFIEEKGFNELIDAFLALSSDDKDKIIIEFAGRFDSESQKIFFLKKIEGIKQVHYHGVVDAEEKKSVFSNVHVFCLPTSLFEGQPISILEAYASGCVVLTTGQDGIRDIFTDGLNGFEIRKRSVEAVRFVLEKMLDQMQDLQQIALHNRRISEKYRVVTYNSSLTKIVTNNV